MFGVQQSMQTLMTLVRNVLVMLMPHARQFGLLVVLSFVAIGSALCLFLVFLLRDQARSPPLPRFGAPSLLGDWLRRRRRRRRHPRHLSKPPPRLDGGGADHDKTAPPPAAAAITNITVVASSAVDAAPAPLKDSTSNKLLSSGDVDRTRESSLRVPLLRLADAPEQTQPQLLLLQSPSPGTTGASSCTSGGVAQGGPSQEAIEGSTMAESRSDEHSTVPLLLDTPVPAVAVAAALQAQAQAEPGTPRIPTPSPSPIPTEPANVGRTGGI